VSNDLNNHRGGLGRRSGTRLCHPALGRRSRANIVVPPVTRVTIVTSQSGLRMRRSLQRDSPWPSIFSPLGVEGMVRTVTAVTRSTGRPAR
jgi:hypothetical protein